MTVIIDGKFEAAKVLDRVKNTCLALAGDYGVSPGLAVIILGEDPASKVYVASKTRTAKECGFHSVQYNLPTDTPQVEVEQLVETLNADPKIHGILVQLPLPSHLDEAAICRKRMWTACI